MQSVKEILQAHGYDSVADMDVGDSIEVELDSEAMLPLTIEKTAENRVSVAHYYEQRMDLMRDPEIVFKVQDGGVWSAVEYVQDNPSIYQRDKNGLPDAQAFAMGTWDENLREQGYVEAAEQAASTSSPIEVTA